MAQTAAEVVAGMVDTLRRGIDSITDSRARARVIHEAITALDSASRDLQVQRRAALRRLRGRGATYQDLADELGVTRQRIEQIINNPPNHAKRRNEL